MSSIASVGPTFRTTLAVIAATLLAASAAEAFHRGGVGSCDGCHGQHQGPTNSDTPTTGAFLLIGGDASSTCLRCHATHGEGATELSTDGSAFTAGGDFYWLKKTFGWNDGSVRKSVPGDRHGHNVVAVDFNLSPDAKLTTAPGGTFSAARLSCTSCHDPHGRPTKTGTSPIASSGSYGAAAQSGQAVGTYRMLRGAGSGATPFVFGAPVAVAPAGNAPETDRNHVAYGSGMSEWCSNCHAALLNTNPKAGRMHPAGAGAKFSPQTLANYNEYVRTGNLSGSQADAYSALVPFETGTKDVTTLNPASRSGPDGESNVMCLSCHRAHASAFASIGRWDVGATFLSDSHPKIADEGASASDAANSYYGRDLRQEFGPYQRSLCNKCHARD